MDKDVAVKVSHLTKNYKLYKRNRDRLFDALGVPGERFTWHPALNDVNLSVKRGETVGIIGTNGSGKSTLLKLITGVLTPTSGTVEVDGHISALLELGSGFNMEYNGIDNIYLNGMMIGFSREEIDSKLDDILKFADIGEYVYQPVKTYSTGMFVRLAFAVAISIDPEILIVDEALSVGDVFFQAKCYHKFEEFRSQGKTILFVSHDLSSISRYCDRAVILNKGKLLEEGSPKQMIDIYKQLLVGQYPLEDETAGEKGTEDDTAGNRQDALSQAAAEVDTLEYGSGKATITSYAVIDNKGREINAVNKGEEFLIRMKVRFNEDVPAPIFAFTFKNALGIEITGTNTMLEKAGLEPAHAGDERTITFRQRMTLQGGDYLLSFGVTGFMQDEFTVYHRLYDVMRVTVLSDKNTVGFYDMESQVTVE